MSNNNQTELIHTSYWHEDEEINIERYNDFLFGSFYSASESLYRNCIKKCQKNLPNLDCEENCLKENKTRIDELQKIIFKT